MMTQNITKRINTVVVAAILVTLVMPMITYAQNDRGGRASTTRGEGIRVNDFCSMLDTAREQALTRITNQRKNIDRTSEAAADREERMNNFEEKRSESETRREERYASLRSYATTTAQQAAVETFVSTVQDLVDARKTAIDAAIAEFEDTVSTLIEERQTALSDTAGSIKDSINAVFDDAEAACDAGTDSTTVRTQFLTDMQTLRETQMNSRSEYTMKDDLAAARATRKEAIDAAQETFRSALEAAKNTLRDAFGQ